MLIDAPGVSKDALNLEIDADVLRIRHASSACAHCHVTILLRCHTHVAF